ncbi:MAG: NAD-dependent epimerase/dehydratase family protein [Desulfovibrionaceae bacterium]
MKRVLLTGSTGLIGKEAILPLKEHGFTVICLNSSECNLLNYDDVRAFVKDSCATHLMHFAWFTGRGYLTSPLNEEYYEASMNLLQAFVQCGGERAVFAGTCLEYANKNTALQEEDPLSSSSLYAKYKNILRINAGKYTKRHDVSFGWGRIFYAYGCSDGSGSLFSYLVENLRENKTVHIHSGDLLRDYIYTKDIVNAFICILRNQNDILVNVCTGTAVRIAFYAECIAQYMKKPLLLRVGTTVTDEAPIIIGENTRLQSLGYRTQYTLEKGLREIFYES